IPTVHNDRIYIGSCADYCMHCFSLDGKELWRFKTEGLTYERSLLLGNHLIFPSWDCNVYCIDINTRQAVWKFRCAGSPAYVPPPFEAFELDVPITQSEVEEKKKTYDLNLSDEGEERTDFYKSRITYQVSTRYQEKGKYQVDSMEEEF
ncbi:MAG: PQQ-like beta-propeller repeat protein, partial [Candidatus Aenigmarchaeota archaeon]|nr:PQQ-like beta-propeller repeat protein [Candidatus Aenigmarchaeota archaeon]